MWTQEGNDEHHWSASIGPYRLRIQPVIANDTIRYRAEVFDAVLNELWAESSFHTVAYAQEGTLEALREQMQRLFQQIVTTEDDAIFGHNAWVWCEQHQKAHQTGWCNVGIRDKLGLGLFGNEPGMAQKALQKCIDLGLKKN